MKPTIPEWPLEKEMLKHQRVWYWRRRKPGVFRSWATFAKVLLLSLAVDVAIYYAFYGWNK